MPYDATLKGPRLEFVVRELKGTVEVTKRKIEKIDRGPGIKPLSKIVAYTDKEPAGFMLYLPSGQSYRLTKAELVAQGYDREPRVINFEAVTNPNTAAGKYKFGRNDKVRNEGWRLMEEQIIKRCRRRHGPAEGVNNASAA